MVLKRSIKGKANRYPGYTKMTSARRKSGEVAYADGERPLDLVWAAYCSAIPADLITLSVTVNGQAMLLNHAIKFSFNDVESLPNTLRLEIVAELEEHRPAYSSGSDRVRVHSYWLERIWRYSQAARAFEPLLVRRMVYPSAR